MSMKFRVSLFLLLLAIVGVAPVFAGSAAIGTVAGSLNATIGGQALLPNSTVFSGDNLQVQDGAAVIAFANGSRMALGHNTVAQFLRDDQGGVAVALAKGNVSMYHPATGSNLQVNIEDWAITPGKGFKTVGEVATLNNAVLVTAKEGSLHVEGNGQAIDVAQGKTITLLPKSNGMPQAGTSQKLVSGSALGAAAAVLAGVGAAFGIASFVEAKDAKDNANSATSAADAAESQAAAATSAADAAGSAANSAGCALNTIAGTVTPASPSPYIPPTGYTCP
jgi:hypothetical protein